MLDKLNQDIKQAMLDGDIARVSVLKMVKSEFQNQTIANKGTLTEDDALKVLAREVKKRKEAAEMYESAGDELRQKTELAEAEIIEAYLPQQMDEAELKELIKKARAENPDANQGQLIGQIMGQVGASADGSTVSKLVREELGQ